MNEKLVSITTVANTTTTTINFEYYNDPDGRLKSIIASAHQMTDIVYPADSSTENYISKKVNGYLYTLDWDNNGKIKTISVNESPINQYTYTENGYSVILNETTTIDYTYNFDPEVEANGYDWVKEFQFNIAPLGAGVQ